jgi:hypothetical protein
MTIISIAFYLSLGLLYLGFTFQYQEIIIGLCAVAIAVVQFVALIRSR